MPTRIFVGNFDDSVNEHDLQSLFLPYGVVKKAMVRWNPKPRKSKRFGFVVMQHAENAELAVRHLDGYLWRGHELKVSFAKRWQRGPR